MTMKYLPWTLFLALFLFSQTAEDVALKTEKKLRSLKSIQADFEQILYSTSISTSLREKGKFYFQKPNSMKWVYQEPEEKIFLYKEGNFFFYLPEDNQLYRGSLSKENHKADILNLLSGQNKFQDSYYIKFSPFPSEITHSFQLKLIPKEEHEYSFILLEIEKKTWLIRKAISFDWAGNKTEYIFSKIKTNLRFPQNFFELKVPPDVEIIEETSE